MAWNLDDMLEAAQLEHNRKHPGKVCGQCPSELMHRASLYQRPRLTARGEILIAWVVVPVVVILLLMAIVVILP